MADKEAKWKHNVDGSYYVDDQCIACDACCQDFPEVFFMGDDQKAHAHDEHPWDLYNARTVVDVCPTGAIEFSGELPPPDEEEQEILEVYAPDNPKARLACQIDLQADVSLRPIGS